MIRASHVSQAVPNPVRERNTRDRGDVTALMHPERPGSAVHVDLCKLYSLGLKLASSSALGASMALEGGNRAVNSTTYPQGLIVITAGDIIESMPTPPA